MISDAINHEHGNKGGLHFLLIPLMAQGHMIPMLDLARLLASHGALVTYITTPVNMIRIRQIVDRIAISAVQVRFVELPFPVTDAGLPDGCENIDLIPSLDLILTFINALCLLHEPLDAYLRKPDLVQWPKPACLISEDIQYWTVDVARSLGIPRLSFVGSSCFYEVCSILFDRHRAELENAVESGKGEPIFLPGLPHPIRLLNHQITRDWRINSGWSKLKEDSMEAAKSADGVLVNSFEELESWYFERYRKETGKQVWPVGPLSLYNQDHEDIVSRGRESSIDQKLLLKWLDKQETGSVVLACFGSIARSNIGQLVEIGHGLEATGGPFVWVVKEAAEEKRVLGVEEWVEEFEKRVEGRGIVIRGWAPQMMIFMHAAVGGFLTHCGWNSTLEAVMAGVVMATWPHVADQFLNEKLVVDVLKIGVAVGVDEPTMLESMKVEGEVMKVKREVVQRVVEMLMGGGEEGDERRRKVRELSEKARRAMEKAGSSWNGLHNAINFAADLIKNN